MKNCLSFLRIIVLVCTTTIGVYTPVFSQTHTARTVNVNSNCGGFYEYLPAGYAASSSQYPVIIAFHGAGSYGTGSTSDLAKVLREQVAFYINRGTFPASFTVGGQTSSFIVISPQLKAAAAPADINSVISYVLNNYKVDRGRVYLSGYSIGANHVFKYAVGSLAYAQQITAFTTMAIYNYPYTDAGSQYIGQAGVSLWAIHSSSDQTAPTTMSSNMVNKINSYSPANPAIIRIVSGFSHVQSDTAFCNPNFRYNGMNIYEWFLSKRRNFPPVARAGADVVLNLPTNSTSLVGSGSTDPENGALTYKWSKIAGPGVFNIANTNTANTTLSNLIAGTYRFELLVTDNYAIESRDTVQVNVVNPLPNVLPIANAGNNQTITLPTSTVSLSGSLSSDNGGAIETYTWQKLSGPATAAIVSPNTVNTQVNFTKKGTYVFKLTVTDNEGGSASSNVQVTVINPFANIAPKAIAGANVEVTLPVNTVDLSGLSSSDQDGEILQYGWSILYGPAGAVIVSPQQATTTVGNLNTGTYGFRLQVTDDNGAIGLDTVEVKVNPLVQILNRNLKVNVYGGANAYTTDRWNNWNVGTGSISSVSSSAFIYEDNGATSGITALLSQGLDIADNGASYGGTMCPPQVLRYTSYSTSQRTLTVRGLNNAYKYNLQFFASRANTGNSSSFAIGSTTKTVVTDNNKANKVEFLNLTPANGQIVITISKTGTYNYLNAFIVTEQAPNTSANGLPIAVANADSISIRVPSNTIQLSSAGSVDADGSITGYTWSKIAGPSSFNIANPFAANTSVTNLVEGSYQFELKVTDNRGGFGLDTVTINVLPPLKPLPISNAGNDVSFKLPINTYRFDANAASLNGDPVVVTWSQLSGPAIAQFDDIHLVDAQVSGLVVGTYTFQLQVEDNLGATANDLVSITVLSVNVAPVAAAGADQSIQLPNTNIQLDGTASGDSDGSISSFNWQYVSGPGGATIQTPGLAQTTVSGLTLGSYTFKLTVTDNDGLSSEDIVAVDVQAAPIIPNAPPVVNAGSDFGITLPQTTVQLSGSASDTDGTIQSYSWQQIQGPSLVQFSDQSIVSPVVSGLQLGTYTFSLTATDDDGATGSDVITVQVNPKPNTAPVVGIGANAGITLPVNSLQLNGIATDAENNISGYAWSWVSGPTNFNFVNGNQPVTVVNGLVAGTYVFRLTVTDTDGASGSATVTITVNPAASPVVRQRILIDFGQTSTLTAATGPDQFGKYWNNVTDARPGVRLTNAKDSANGATTVGFEVINRIDGTFAPSGNGINTGNSTTAVGDYPGSAVEDNAYAHSSTTSGKWRVFGLDPARNYTFKFWGTRAASGTRVLQIKDSRATTWVEEFDAINNNNYNRAAFIRNISGVTEVSFDIRCKSGQTYGDISVLDITSEMAPAVTITGIQTISPVSAVGRADNAQAIQPLKPGVLHVYPNPVKDLAFVQFSNDYKGTVQVQVVNAMGTIVARYSFTKSQPSFESRIQLPSLPLGKYQIVVVGSNFRLTNALMRY
ncbi:MAG TPA: PKD domain-containing protein [Phnomibacter sp.]|nr:PKD domain-containing protein [Phnomibacter sp.]